MRQVGTKGRSVRLALAILAAAGSLALSGCGSSTGTVAFRCGPQINGGLALAVDVVRATEQEARNIQTMGEKWFYDQSRLSFQGQNRIQTLTFTAGVCDPEHSRITATYFEGNSFIITPPFSPSATCVTSGGACRPASSHRASPLAS